MDEREIIDAEFEVVEQRSPVPYEPVELPPEPVPWWPILLVLAFAARILTGHY
jgi:hypothetical protein